MTFYRPDQGRQVRVGGSVRAESAALSAADFRARPSTRTEAAMGWTLYTLLADEFEFFQGVPDRRHVRLRYVRQGHDWGLDPNPGVQV